MAGAARSHSSDGIERGPSNGGRARKPAWVEAVARTLGTLLGALVGALFGLALTLSIVVGMARAGHFIFALHDLAEVRWETLPVPLGLIGGGWLAFRRTGRFWRAAAMGLVGAVAGSSIGSLLGVLLAFTPEGRWTAGVIGATAVGWALAIDRLLRSNARPSGSSEDASGGVPILLPRSARDARREARVAWMWGAAALTLILAGTLALGTGIAESPAETSSGPLGRDRPLPPIDEVESVTFLVGDAGKTIPDRSPLLEAMRHDIENWAAVLDPGAVSVLFLGDLVYPVGVRDRSHPQYVQDSTRLWNQIELLAGPNARERGAAGWFVPGNHDWGNTSGTAGLDRIVNLDRELSRARSVGIRAELQPPFGGAGPSIVDVGRHLRVAMVDTHWFLQNRSRERTEGFIAGVRGALRTAGDRHVLIAAHHPYRSVGPHGATPLDPAWGVGFVLRKSGAIVQDLNSTVYAELLHRMQSVFAVAERPPLIFAGGHDHSLQVLEGETVRDPVHVLVSGAGSKVSSIEGSPQLAFGAARPGYMKLVTTRDGGITLFVVAGDPERLVCPEAEPERTECMVSAGNDFEIVFAKRLAEPGPQVGSGAASDEGTPWWVARSPDSIPEIELDPEEAVRRAPPVAVPMRVLYFDPDSVVTNAGKEYEASAVERLVIGDLYRRVWRLPIRLPVVDLDTLGGGARLEETTGGLQTFGARFETESGIVYQFRSIVKDGTAAVPEPLRETPIAASVNDQMSSQFPLAAMVVAELLRATGAHVTDPVPVVLPNSPRLGKYRPFLAGRVGWLEVWPNERDGDRPGFASSRKIIDGEKILETLDEDSRSYADAGSYLRVRLIDILVGDWDRHIDQWRWASFPDGDRTRWEPISRDRDRAFNRAEAVPEALSGLFLPRYVGFEREYPPIDRLVQTGAQLDERILAGLSAADFVGEAERLAAALPDSTLRAAVRVLPPAYLAEVGDELFEALRARRDGLAGVARAFHRDLARRAGA